MEKELEINKKKDMILLYDCWANIPGKYRNTLLYVKIKLMIILIKYEAPKKIEQGRGKMKK